MTHAGIECFLAVCRHKTGSKAAQSLYITQSSLSTRLKTLERELGGQLFYRKKGCREMTLTPAGKEFYELALQYEMLIDKMQNVCHSRPYSLRISSLNSLATYLLPKVYERFLQQNPGVRLELQDMKLPEVGRSIRNAETDLALTAGKTTDSLITQKPVFSEPMVMVCSQFANYREPVKLHQLPHHEEVYIEWNDNYSRWHRQIFGDRLPQIRVSIMAHLRQFMEAEQCWAIVPLSVAEGLQKECNVRCLETTNALPCREISILTAAETSHNPVIYTFEDCLRRVVSQYPDIRLL